MRIEPIAPLVHATPVAQRSPQGLVRVTERKVPEATGVGGTSRAHEPEVEPFVRYDASGRIVESG